MTTIITYENHHFDYSNPTPTMISVGDITRGLAHSFRFAGQTKRPYTVAQHCVECSYLVPEKFALEALLHDASEAYCKDIPQPLKQLLPDYKMIELSVDRAVRLAFHLPAIESLEVKMADIQSLKNEMVSFNIKTGYINQKLEEIEPTALSIDILDPKDAFYQFKARFIALTKDTCPFFCTIYGHQYWRSMPLDFEY